ncbi:MAG: protease inhibitor Inh/omp19 family protein [Alphaproteobacteria bacterium]|nr:protease inhibitor Inh/omp19 family protein [Alphaproteobacteria bacterium]MBU2379242.1 protease inhibitor Inh/omp19 family protein [Alphaproteobacteria bacterium]
MRRHARDHARILAVAVGAILMTGCAPSPSASEPQGQVLAVEQVAGHWSLRAPDGARCTVSLANLVIDGVRPVLAESCAIPDAAKARSWRATATGFELLDAAGSVLMAFRRTGEDAFEAVDGGYILRRAPLS